MRFDVNMGEKFRRKAMFEADSHETEAPSSMTYGTIVPRDSVRICLTIASLNDLDVLVADVEDAYLSESCHERVWMRAGPGFGDIEGKVSIVRQSLYGLKSSGATFQSFLAEENTNLRRKRRYYLPRQ